MAAGILSTRTCERCGTAIPLDQVKYFPKGINERIMLCDKCSQQRQSVMKEKLGYRSKMGQISGVTQQRILATSKIIPGVKKPGPTLRQLPAEPKIIKKDNADGVADKVPYFCSRCNYKFPVDQFRVERKGNVQCPYCGKTDKTKRLI